MDYLTLVDVAGRLAKRAKKGSLAAMPEERQARFLDRARSEIRRWNKGKEIKLAVSREDGPDLEGDSEGA